MYFTIGYTPALLSHKCVTPVIYNMSNKHPRYAASHAPSSIALGMIIPLCPYYLPAQARADSPSRRWWRTQEQVLHGLWIDTSNSGLLRDLCVHRSREMAYKICPETDWRSQSIGEPDVSIQSQRAEEPLWSDRVKTVPKWYDKTVGESTWKWSADGGSSGQSSSWNRGSQKRGASAPPGKRLRNRWQGKTTVVNQQRHLFSGARLNRSNRMRISRFLRMIPRTPANQQDHQQAQQRGQWQLYVMDLSNAPKDSQSRIAMGASTAPTMTWRVAHVGHAGIKTGMPTKSPIIPVIRA